MSSHKKGNKKQAFADVVEVPVSRKEVMRLDSITDAKEFLEKHVYGKDYVKWIDRKVDTVLSGGGVKSHPSEIHALFSQCVAKAAKCNPYVRVRIQTYARSLDKSFVNDLTLSLERYLMGRMGPAVIDALSDAQGRPCFCAMFAWVVLLGYRLGYP